jgi:shikimate kinase
MMMDTDRTAVVTIGGVEYPLIFTTKATKEIAKRYGGLANLGETLMKNENFEMALDEVTWLIALLANQSILIHNLQNDEKKPLLTEEAVELLTTPLELADYKNAITEAMINGTKRHIESEDNTFDGEPLKNVKVE